MNMDMGMMGQMRRPGMGMGYSHAGMDQMRSRQMNVSMQGQKAQPTTSSVSGIGGSSISSPATQQPKLNMEKLEEEFHRKNDARAKELAKLNILNDNGDIAFRIPNEYVDYSLRYFNDDYKEIRDPNQIHRLWSGSRACCCNNTIDSHCQHSIIHTAEGTITSMRFRQDGKVFGSAGTDKVIKLVNVDETNFTKMENIYGNNSAITDIAFHPYSAMLASSSDNGDVCIFTYNENHSWARKSPLQARINLNTSLLSIDYHPTGSYITTVSKNDRAVRIIDLVTENKVEVRMQNVASAEIGYVSNSHYKVVGGYTKTNAFQLNAVLTQNQSTSGDDIPGYHSCRWLQQKGILIAAAYSNVDLYDLRQNLPLRTIELEKSDTSIFTGIQTMKNGLEVIISKIDAADKMTAGKSLIYDVRNTKEPIREYADIGFFPTTIDNDKYVIGGKYLGSQMGMALVLSQTGPTANSPDEKISQPVILQNTSKSKILYPCGSPTENKIAVVNSTDNKKNKIDFLKLNY